MKKKGFTLVEILGVIILLGIIALIIVPAVDTTIKQAKQKAYDKQVASLLNSLKNWNSDNKSLFKDNQTVTLTLQDLKEEGYVDFDIRNPKTSKCISNNLEFQVEKVNKKYNYTIIGGKIIDGEDKDCDTLKRYPSIYLIGNNPYKLEVKNEYEEPGYVAKNLKDVDITASVQTSNNINKNILGKYRVTYLVTDGGLEKSKSRVVNVVDKTKPTLTIPSDSKIYDTVETIDLLSGVSVYDNYDENVDIQVVSTLSLGVIGKYTVDYIAKDLSGNVTRKSRNITIIQDPSTATTVLGSEWVYDYTGNYELFTVPRTGTYKVELWGAQGGYAPLIDVNKAGYTKGEIVLEKGTKLYIYVGQKGDANRTVKFNGGGIGGSSNFTNYSGPNTYGQSGGGATDIRLISGTWDNTSSLRSRIMVAAGSGGTAGVDVYDTAGEHSIAGGLSGYAGGYYSGHSFVNQNGKGATQIAGGTAGNNHYSATGVNSPGQFGIGGDCNSTSDQNGAGGGGGGYYGGGAGGSTLAYGNGQGGGGGSSYISGHTGCVAIQSADSSSPKSGCTQGTTDNTCSIHYSNIKFNNTTIRDGKQAMPTHDGDGTMTGNSGDGYVKITYISE